MGNIIHRSSSIIDGVGWTLARWRGDGKTVVVVVSAVALSDVWEGAFVVNRIGVSRPAWARIERP
jgi:hypothetical protein